MVVRPFPVRPIPVHVLSAEQLATWQPPAALLLQQSGFASLVPILLMIGFFVVLVILPARKRQKKLDQMLANLAAGDQVVTNGGLAGTVVGLTDSRVTLRIAPDGLKLEFARSAVVSMAEKADS